MSWKEKLGLGSVLLIFGGSVGVFVYCLFSLMTGNYTR